MTAPDLLVSLAASGVSVSADAGTLRLRPARAVPDELRGALLELKPELLLLLSGAASEYSDQTGEASNPATGSTPAIAPTAPDVPPALLEYSDRVFDESLRVWQRGQWIETTRGTLPAYACLVRERAA